MWSKKWDGLYPFSFLCLLISYATIKVELVLEFYVHLLFFTILKRFISLFSTNEVKLAPLIITLYGYAIHKSATKTASFCFLSISFFPDDKFFAV